LSFAQHPGNLPPILLCQLHMHPMVALHAPTMVAADRFDTSPKTAGRIESSELDHHLAGEKVTGAVRPTLAA
jgi:hypothetical protein